MEKPLRILGFAGSLRKDSYNKALLRAAIDLAPEELVIEFYDLEGIPLFNADLEKKGDPDPVTRFRQAIRDADGLLIASPEYNHGVTGVLKNAVDWASRPPKNPPLDGKAIGIIGASPGLTGTARSQSQLRQVLVYTNSFCMPQPEMLVSRAARKFDGNGRLADEKTEEFLKKYLRVLYDWILTFRHTPEYAG